MTTRNYQLPDVLEEEYRALRPQVAVPPSDPAADDCARLAAIQQRMRDDESGLAALCLSGGGIRSATFALGVVQGLARHGLIGKFDYLSTVSGGGYLGGWLSAWAQRHPQGIAGVERELTSACVATAARPPEPEPLRHLRDYSNYLSPRLGLFSVDGWTLAVIYLRNLLLNWLMLLPLLFALLWLPRLFMAALRWEPPSGVLVAAAIVVVALLVFGMGYMGYDRPSTGKPYGGQRQYLRQCLLPLGIAVVLIALLWTWLHHGRHQLLMGMLAEYPVAWLVGTAVLIYFGGWLSHLFRRRSAGDDSQPRWRVVRKYQEAGAALAAGLIAGLLVWCWAGCFPQPYADPESAAHFLCFGPPLLWLAFQLAEVVFTGLASRVTDEEDREWWARSGAWVLIAISGWLMLNVPVLYGPQLLFGIQEYVAAAGGLVGALTAWAGSSALTAGSVRALARGKHRRGIVRGATVQGVLSVATLAFIVILAAFMAYGADLLLWRSAPSRLLDHWDMVYHYPDPWQLFGWPVLFATIGLAMALVINVNKFSLHALYRNRLIRAYLGASRPPCPPQRDRRPAHDPSCRDPHPFTGFDPCDNVQMRDLWPNRPLATAQSRPPLHVVNMALNLVSGEALAWQQRKAASFTVTPLHAGGCCVGYREARDYGGYNGISLGTAMAISGAAVSPNMGYNTSPLISVLLGMFDVRLGWWLGNPRNASSWRRKGPDFAIRPLVAELLGLANEHNPWVYLSDGGHFDNLGLYEMVQRRCRLIVVCDAGADPAYGFEDLGNALRKIRIDTGVPIERQGDLSLYPRTKKRQGKYAALFRVLYSCVDGPAPDGRDADGLLLYLKPAYYGDEPADVCNYAKTCPAFPHEPTGDQFFSESQFESYRRLGQYEIETLIGGLPIGALDDLFAAARQHCAPVLKDP